MKCKKCGRGGLFDTVNENGLCSTCAEYEQEKIKLQMENQSLKYKLVAAEAQIESLTRAEKAREVKIQMLEKHIKYLNPPASESEFEFEKAIPKKYKPQEISERNPRIESAKDYCVIDTETTGLVMGRDRIIEIAIIKIKDGEPAARYSTLVNPGRRISQGASEVNGLTEEDLADAPSFDEIADEVSKLLGEDTIIGHNPAFDTDFLWRELAACGHRKQFLYFDTWKYAKKIRPGLSNYKLQTLLKEFNISPGTAHRAADDAEATYQLFKKLKEIEAAEEKEKKRLAREERERKNQERRETYAGSPILEMNFCYTGSFSKTREEMEQEALNCGGCVRQQVNGKTAYLVLGNIEDLPEWAVERKYGKAKQLIEQGKPLKIISEAEYAKIIEDAMQALKKEN